MFSVLFLLASITIWRVLDHMIAYPAQWLPTKLQVFPEQSVQETP